MRTMSTIFRDRRISDVITAICFPIFFVLCLHASFLSRDLRAISNGDFSGTSSYEASNLETENNIQSNEVPPHLLWSNRSKQFLEALKPPLNNTGKANQDLLLFTPIFRSGSISMKYLLKNLRRQNNFITISPTMKAKEVIYIPSLNDQASAAKKMSALEHTTAVIDPIAFINFTQFGYKQPIQVSMVRDPLEMAISSYYFIRAPYRLVERQKQFPNSKLPSRLFLKKSIEKCLSDPKDKECRYTLNEERIGHTIQYFCGHEHFCKLFANEDGMKRAKEVVENSFAVVAIAEEWEKSVIVLEHLIPSFFSGAYDLYPNTLKEKLQSKNIYKAKVDPWAREMLQERLSPEYDFYNFLLKRLNQQYEAIVKLKQESS